MVARQRERSAGGGGRGERCAWERRPQGVEPLGVILSLSPCPPRRFFRHAWGCAPPRRGRGRGELLPPSPPRGRPPPHVPLPSAPPSSRLYSRPEAWQWEAIPSEGLAPQQEGGGRPPHTPPHPPSPAAGRAGGRGGGPQPLGHPEHPAAGARRSHPLPCLVPSSGSFPRF